VSLAAYFETARALLEAIQANEAEPMRRVAERLAECIREDHIIYTFGSGHSSLLAAEGLFRAGGLACVSAILEPTTTFAGGALAGTAIERMPGISRSVMARYGVAGGDVLVVFSNSGVNALPVELTEYCRDRGLTTVAITSRRYAVQAAGSGHRPTLLDLADHVIDNHVPPGDAAIEVGSARQPVASLSTLAGAFIWNALVAEVADRLVDQAITPPVYVSSNMTGAKEVNAALVDRYRHRIRNL
jgi:uncharacterized phosphosugar-binding protein